MSSAISSAIMQAAPMANSNGGFSGGSSANPFGNVYTAMLGSALSGLGNSITASSQAKNMRKAYEQYLKYLSNISSKMGKELTQRADKYDTKLQNMFTEAEPQYQLESNTQLAELQPLISDIANQSSEAQRQNQRQINAALAQQGVRGGQAAILANRATGELNRDLQRDINKTIYDEAANRQQSRLNYYGQKALTPYNTMANAYGSSMTGANNALSANQGAVYQNAYNTAMGNYLGSKNMNASGLSKYLGGGLSLAGGVLSTGANYRK